ncbi:MAG: L-2-amino-thiazoline-4-carboxylic acid hydrolase [Candidatus Thorarchaeota archaeon]
MAEAYYWSKRKKLLKRYKKFSSSIGEKITQRYGNDFSERILGESLIEYEKIIPEIPHLPGKINFFRQILILNAMSIALYKPMKKAGKTSDEIFTIFYEHVEDMFSGIPKFIKWLVRNIAFSRIFLWLARKTAKNASNHPEGWKIEFYKGDGVECDWYYEATECAVIKFYEKLDVTEISIYCNFFDYLQSKFFGMGFKQDSCIGQGDKTCVECMKKGRETTIPDNLKKIFPSLV